MPDTLADLRTCFPVAEAWIHLNHAACAPLAVPVRDALVAFADECLRQGSADFAGWLAKREEARALFAALIGAQPGEVAFVTSTSQGLLTVAEGEGQAIERVYGAIHKGNPTKDLIAIKYLEALAKMSEGQATKMFVPYEASGILSAVSVIAEAVKDKKAESKP